MIYLLKRTQGHNYDEYDAKVVRARNKREARLIANKDTGDEGGIWTSYGLVTCESISSVGDSVEILGSFNAG